MVDYNDKFFKAISFSHNSETSSDTLFHYRQDRDLLKGTYSGGGIRFGHLIGLVDERGNINMRYHQLTENGNLQTGVCKSRAEIDSNGKIILHENWNWTSGDFSSGSSVLKEIDPI